MIDLLRRVPASWSTAADAAVGVLDLIQFYDTSCGPPLESERGHLKSSVAFLSPLQIIHLDLPIQRRAFDVENRRRVGLVPVGVLQGAEDVLPLHLFQAERLENRRRWRQAV